MKIMMRHVRHRPRLVRRAAEVGTARLLDSICCLWARNIDLVQVGAVLIDHRCEAFYTRANSESDQVKA